MYVVVMMQIILLHQPAKMSGVWTLSMVVLCVWPELFCQHFNLDKIVSVPKCLIVTSLLYLCMYVQSQVHSFAYLHEPEIVLFLNLCPALTINVLLLGLSEGDTFTLMWISCSAD